MFQGATNQILMICQGIQHYHRISIDQNHNEESVKYLFILGTKHLIDYLTVNSRAGY